MSDSSIDVKQQMQQLADYLRAQREAILDDWRARVEKDSKLQDVSEWTLFQFRDHIPFLLDAFEDKLQAWPQQDTPAQKKRERDAVDAHSRHRWQQGYDLRSIVREWGIFNESLVNEFHNFAAQQSGSNEGVLREAHRTWAQLLNEYISENVVEYSRLAQAEAATRARELEQVIEQLRALQEERGEILRTATHDLRGGLSIVMGSATMMEAQGLPPAERAEFREMFQRGFGSLSGMLSDLMSMARLEAGQETRVIEPFDAGELLTLLCASSQHLATRRDLFLRFHGPETMPVKGDAVKVQRIAQNLLLNGLKYTQQGGVTITWGGSAGSDANWELCVEDTGPGLQEGTAAPLAHKMEQATDAAHDVEGVTLAAPTGPANQMRNPVTDMPGEGVGLSIVKRLCGLLNASIELQTTDGVGSKFRIVFPRHYEK